MAVSVHVVEEVNPGTRDAGWNLELPNERITARELIRSRVYQEVTELDEEGQLQPGSDLTFLRLLPLVGG